MNLPDRAPTRPSATGLLAPSRIVLTVALVLVAVGLSLLSLRSLVLPGAWTGTGSVLLLLLAAVVLVVRLVVRAVAGPNPRLGVVLVPTSAAAVVGLWFVLARFGGPADGSFAPWVTIENVRRVGSLLTQARVLTIQHAAPIDPFEPIVLLAVAGIGLVFVLADLLANGLRMPALGGIAIVLIWLPQLLLVAQVPVAAMVGTCACLLVLLAVDNPHAGTRRYPDPQHDRFVTAPRLWLRLRLPAISLTAASVAVVTVVALTLPLVLPRLPVWASVTAPSLRGTGDQIQVSDTLGLRTSLGPRANNVVLTYRTEGAPEPLRTTTVVEFDGQTWLPSDPSDLTTVVDPDGTLWPATLGSGGETYDLDVSIVDLRDAVLPMPTEPRAVVDELDAGYDPIRDTVDLSRATARDESFAFRVAPRDLSAETLAGQASPGGVADATYRELAIDPALVVPGTSHIDDIAGTAAQITAGARTPYLMALALQDYLRDGSEFTYSLDLPPARTDDAVWDFLTDRTGYCVQFASAMAIMARTLGMPARVGIGFLPGEREGDQMVVRGRDAHAWTEIYFEGAGWVRFEPTPGVQSGTPPEWARADEQPAPAPTPTTAEPTIDPVPTEDPTTAGPEEATDTPTSATAPGGRDGSWTLIALVAGLLTAAGAAAWVALRRAARARRPDGVEAAWASVLEHARRLGVTIPVSATVRQVADLLESDQEDAAPAATTAALPSPVPTPGATAGPVHELARLVEESRFSERASAPSRDAIAHLRAESVAGMDRQFISPRRAGGPSAPRDDA